MYKSLGVAYWSVQGVVTNTAEVVSVSRRRRRLRIRLMQADSTKPYVEGFVELELIKLRQQAYFYYSLGDNQGEGLVKLAPKVANNRFSLLGTMEDDKCLFGFEIEFYYRLKTLLAGKLMAGKSMAGKLSASGLIAPDPIDNQIS